MDIARLDNGFFKIERDGKMFIGFEVGPSRARISSSLSNLRSSTGRIFSPDSPNTQETWHVQGHLAFQDSMIVYGPWVDLESDLTRLPERGLENALALIGKLSHAVEHMPGQDELFSKGLVLNGFLSLRDGRILMLPHQVQDIILSLQPAEIRFKVYDAYHHPSYKGIDAFRFGFAVLAYHIACGNLPWERERGAVDYAHRILADSFAGPGTHLPSTSPKLETLAKTLFSAKQKNLNAGELQSFVLELRSCAQGLGDKALSESVRQDYKKKEKGFQNQTYWKKNGLKIAVAVVVVLLVSIIPASMISKELRDPRTLNMSPDQVVASFYKGFNDLDSELMQDSVAKGVGARQIDTATNFFVVDRIRTATEGKETRMPPEEYVRLGKPVLAYGINVFGIAGLKIEERKELRREGSRVYDVRYDFYSPGQADADALHSVIEIESRHELVRVNQNKDRKNLWQIAELKAVP